MCIYNRLQQVNPHFFLGEAFQCRFVLFPSVELYWISAYGILIMFCRWGNSGHWNWWLPYSSAPHPHPVLWGLPRIYSEINVWVIHHNAPLTAYLAITQSLGKSCILSRSYLRKCSPLWKCSKVEKFWDEYWTSNILSLFQLFGWSLIP